MEIYKDIEKKAEEYLLKRSKEEFDMNIKQGNYFAAYVGIVSLAVFLKEDNERSLYRTDKQTLRSIARKILTEFVEFDNNITFRRLLEEFIICEVIRTYELILKVKNTETK